MVWPPAVKLNAWNKYSSKRHRAFAYSPRIKKQKIIVKKKGDCRAQKVSLLIQFNLLARNDTILFLLRANRSIPGGDFTRLTTDNQALRTFLNAVSKKELLLPCITVHLVYLKRI